VHLAGLRWEDSRTPTAPGFPAAPAEVPADPHVIREFRGESLAAPASTRVSVFDAMDRREALATRAPPPVRGAPSRRC
jgi:hypothetical protein